MLVVCSVILFNSSIVFVLQSYNKIMNTQKDLRVKLQRNRNIKGLSMLKALQALGLKRMALILSDAFSARNSPHSYDMGHPLIY